MPVLQTKNISKNFDGVRAVHNLSLQITEGKITSIIGPNGSGKSTLINLISGVVPFNGGIVVVGGEELSGVRSHKIAELGITRTFQEVRLFEQMTVLDNILVVLTKRNIYGSLFETHQEFHLHRAKEILDTVDLWEKKRELAKNLSYGQRKLLEIARAVAMTHGIGISEARIFLFDEPFAGLFPEMKKIVISVMKKLRQEGRTLVLIEHNMELIRQLSDYVYVLDSGELLAEGVPEEVLSKKEVMEAYLGE